MTLYNQIQNSFCPLSETGTTVKPHLELFSQIVPQRQSSRSENKVFQVSSVGITEFN